MPPRIHTPRSLSDMPRFYAVIAALVVLHGPAVFVVPSAAGAGVAAPLLDAALQSLTNGDRQRMVSLFRYFEESVAPGDVSRDKQILSIFFGLLDTHFGRPAQFQATRSTANTFVNLHMASATVDLWRNSDCYFREYAFKTTFLKNQKGRAADVLLEACLDSQLRPVSLRKVDVHFTNPDAGTVREVEALFQRFRQEVEKVRGPRTQCDGPAPTQIYSPRGRQRHAVSLPCSTLFTGSAEIRKLGPLL